MKMNKFNLCFTTDVYFWTLLTSAFSAYSPQSQIITLRYFLEKYPTKVRDCAIISRTFGSQPLFNGPTSCFSQ